MLGVAGAQQAAQSPLLSTSQRSVSQTLTGGTPQLQAQMSGGRSAISVAVADFDRDGSTDLVTGYALASGGALTLQRGNPAAVAPTGADFTAFTQGVIAPAFQSSAQTFALPVRPDFLVATDVNGDGPIDLVVAARGDTNAYVLTGRGKGNFNAPQAIALNGSLTALSTWRQADGSSLVMAGVCSGSACSLQLLSADGTLKAALPLPGAATAFDMARLNAGNLEDIAVAAGGQVLLFNGDSVAKGSPQSETLPVTNALTLAAGSYVYDARSLMQLAVLDAGGTLHVLARAGVDSHQYTPAEIRALKPWGRAGAAPEGYVNPYARPAGMPWADVESLPGVGPADGSLPLMLRGRFNAGTGADDLAVVNSANVTRVAHPSVLNGSLRTPAPVVALDPTSAPVLAAAVARLSPDVRSSIVTADGAASPRLLLPRVTGITFYVNAPGDTNDDLTTTGRCINNVPSSTLLCSLRDAINLSTKSPTGPNTIMVPAGNYILTQLNTFSDNSGSANYHLDVDSNVTIVGAGASSTIINANKQDKVMSLNSSNNLGANSNYYAYSIGLTGIELLNGKNPNTGTVENVFGGDFDWEADNGSLTLTNVTITGGTAAANSYGGGVYGDNYYGTASSNSTLTITGSTISSNTAVDQGGGIFAANGLALSLSGSTVTGNSVTDASGSGAGILLKYTTAGNATITSTITNSTISNNSISAYQGGGLDSELATSVTGSTFSGNTAGTFGGGILFSPQPTSTRTVVDSTFTGNTGAIFVQSGATPSQDTVSISYSRFHGNTASGSDTHTGVGVGESAAGASAGAQVTATNNWWGCNPTTSTTSIAGNNCDTAGPNTGTASTFSGNPYTSLILSLSTPTPTGPASFSATASTAQNSSGTAYSGTEDNVLAGVAASLSITQPDTTVTAVNGTLSSTDTISQSATPDTGVVDYGAGSAAVTVDGFTVTTPFTLEESDLTVTSSHTGNFFAGSTGDNYTLTVTNSGNSVTSGTVTLVDTLPNGFTATAISGTNWNCSLATLTCTTTVTEAGTTVFPAITLTVTANSTAGTYSNSVTVSGGGELDGNNDTATDSTLVIGAPTFSEAFSPGNIATGGTSAVTFTITNPSANSISLTGVAFTDSLPTGLVVATPNGVSTTCSGGTVTATAASSSISLSGTTVAAGASCTVKVNVTSSTAGAYTNTTGTITSSNAPAGSTASATLDVFTTPGFSESFSPATIATGGTSTVTFTITNASANPATYTGLTFTDSLPTNLVVATPNGAGTTCTSGSVTATAGSSSIALSGAQVAPGATCGVTVNVTSATAGSYVNTTSALTDIQGVSGTTGSATLTVLSQPTVAIALSPTTISPSGTSSLSFTITNSNSSSLTGIAVSDTFPAGVIVASPNGLTGSCGGGTITAPSNAGGISLSGATVAANSTCQFSVNITTGTAGIYPDTTGNISSTALGNGPTSNTVTLTVGDTIWLLNPNMELERVSESGVTVNTTTVTGTSSTAGAIAFRASGDPVVAGNANNNLYVYSPTGGLQFTSTPGVNTPTGLAVDGLSNAWIANGNNTVGELPGGYAPARSATAFQSGTGLINAPTGILVDNAGSVWVVNSGNNTVTKIIGVAAPTVTPTVTGVINSTLGTEP
jgi:uncharacterized repeat protein (TIGR01451 family)